MLIARVQTAVLAGDENAVSSPTYLRKVYKDCSACPFGLHFGSERTARQLLYK